jgi:hypothetical protein
LTLTAPGKPAWLTFTDNGNGTGTLTGTPTNADVGPHAVTLAVSDGTVTVEQSFDVTVTSANDAPVFTSAPVTSATEDQLYTYTVTATDADLPAQTLTYSIAGGTDAGRFVIDPATGMLSFQTAPDYEAPVDANGDNIYEVVVQVSDGNGGSDSQAITVTVADVANTLTVSTSDDLSDGDVSSIEALNANPGVDGAISLREAILAANNTSGADHITFAIAGAGTHVINLTSALPTITGTLSIDGYSQPGAIANSLSAGTNAVLSIQIDGSGVAGSEGLVLAAGSDGSSIKGLSITGFDGLANGYAAIAVLSDNNTIQGNYIGVAADGVTTGANDSAISLRAGASGNLIGGADPDDRNVLSGNSYAGIAIQGVGTDSNQIIGNYIGSDATGAGFPGNASFGVVIWDGSRNNSIGGIAPGEGNLITGNRDGVLIDENGSAPYDNSIRGNSIFGNAEQGIDLNNDQVTLNDSLDNDTGPNSLQNFPVISAASLDGATLNVTGTLNSRPGMTFVIDLYASQTGDASGYGEGARYLGSLTLTTNGSGDASFSHDLTGTGVAAGEVVSATATRSSGSTSEFSRHVTVTLVNHPPAVANAIPDQSATEDVLFSFTFDSNTFADIDAGDTLTYSTSVLPGWLSFNAGTRTFTGTPENADVGTQSITVRATDGAGLLVEDTFILTIANANDTPTVANSIPDQVATEDVPFSFQFAANTFSDVDAGDAFLYVANGPAWLSFDAATRTFTGTPANADVGTHSITVRAIDSADAWVEDSFDIVVANANDTPTVANSIPDQVATEDVPFSFQFAANTFSDVDAGDTFLYIANGPAWLSFDNATRTFTGTPANADVGTRLITLRATDGAGEWVETSFNLTVSNVNDAPVLVTNTLSIAGGQTLTLTTGNLNVSDVDNSAGELTYVVSGVQFGRFELAGQPGVAVTAFSHAQLRAGDVVFVSESFTNPPSYSIYIDDGLASVGPVAASIVFAAQVTEVETVARPPADLNPVETEATEVAPDNESFESKILSGVGEILLPEEPSAGLQDMVQSSRLILPGDAQPFLIVEAQGRPIIQVVSNNVPAIILPPAMLQQIQFANLDAMQIRAMTALSQGMGAETYLDKLDLMRDAMKSQTTFEELVIGSSAAVSGSLSIGYVLWLLRSGALVGSLLAAMPAWTVLDPVPVLAYYLNRNRKSGDDDLSERMFDKAGAPVKATPTNNEAGQ